MITIRNKKTKQIITKTDKKANLILNNKVFGSDWVIVSQSKIEAPPEAIKEKVSIDKKTTKGTK